MRLLDILIDACKMEQELRMSQKKAKHGKKIIDSNRKVSNDWPVVVYVWVIGLFLAFWFVGGAAMYFKGNVLT